MAEVLKTRDYHKELPPSRTIISLGYIHDSGEKGDGALYSVHRGGEYRAHRDIRRIGVQNESLVWLWVSQSDRLGEASLEALEGLLGLGRPRETHPLLGQCRKWFRDASEILDEFTVIRSKAEKGAHIADALWHRPILDGANLFPRVNARGGDHVAQKKMRSLKRQHFEGFTLRSTL